MDKSKLIKYAKNPRLLYVRVIGTVLRGTIENDERYLKLLFRTCIGYELDLENPKTFNEKLQWLKLYDRNPFYTKLVDKYEVKEWVAEQIGREHIVPTLGVWDSFDEIDFDGLPNKFVLKCTHDSGGLAICRDKLTFDKEAARRKIGHSLSRNYFYGSREWPYKNVKPRIIAEEYLDAAANGDLADYKIFCFDGQPKALFVATERASGDTKFDFYDVDFRHLPLENGHPNASAPPQRPVNYNELLRMARVLSAGIPQVRVDFYDIEGKPYFGEMTFSHMSGLMPFVPEEYDRLFGSWIHLPQREGSI